MPQTTFSSQTIWSGQKVKSTAHLRDHRVTIDEPESLGGTDSGPNPVELVLAALGGCINVLVTSFAGIYEVELKKVQVDVEGDLDSDGLLEKNPAVRPGFQEIRYRIQIDSPSPQGRIQALIEHVERVCPVKDTLKGVPVKALVTSTES